MAPASAVSGTAIQEVEAPAAKTGWRPVANLGITYGGVDLYTANFANGTSFTVTSGSLLEAGVGGLWQAEHLPVAVQLTANYHTDSYDAAQNLKYILFNTPPSSGTPLFFQRYPIEALAYYTGFQDLRIGGGARFVRAPRAVGVNNGVNEELLFKNTVGWVAEVGIAMDQVWVNFRFVSERYEPSTLKQNGVITPASGNRISGSHIGINVIVPLDELDGHGGSSDNRVSDESSYNHWHADSQGEEGERSDVFVSGKRNVQINGH